MIGGIRFKLLKLQEKTVKAQKIRVNKYKVLKDFEGILYYQSLIYIPKLIKIELISRYHDNLLVGHYSIRKI